MVKEKNMKVPNLRFPEFEGEWEKNKLGELFDISAGGDIEKEHISEYKTESFKYPIYANTTINKGLYGYSDIYKIESYALTVAGRGVNLGIAHARNHCFYPIVRLLVLKPKIDLNIFFFEHSINKVSIFTESTGIPQLTVPQISIYKVSYPSNIEQEKIATFLSLIDQRIETQNKIIEKLQSLMKGVSHFIFKNKKPNIKLKDCVTCHSSTLTENEIVSDQGDYPIYGATGILANIPQYEIEEDAILIIKDGASVGKVQYATGKYSVIGTLNYLTLKQGTYLQYIYYYLKMFNFNKFKVGSSIPHIYFKDYGNTYIYRPSFKEQKKLAKILSSINKKIELEKYILCIYKRQKVHLIQTMFI
ncbi:MAG: restriction endonuclease subunit S [Bacteroides sp.]|nr:restriction endonuclease subunit S [Bacteroides sp.]